MFYVIVALLYCSIILW